MWGGIALTIGVLLCLLARPLWSCGRCPHMCIRRLLACMLLALVWTARPGRLAHAWQQLPDAIYARQAEARAGSLEHDAAPASFYAKHIHPILDSNCVAAMARQRQGRSAHGFL